MVTDDVGEDSIEIVVIVPSVVAAVVVVRVGVIGLQGVALPSVVLVFSVSGSEFVFLWWAFTCWTWKGPIFLRLFPLSWLHRRG